MESLMDVPMLILPSDSRTWGYAIDRTDDNNLHKLCQMEPNKLVDILDIRKYRYGHTPTLNLIINKDLTDPQIVSFLGDSAARNNLTLRRGIASLFFGYHIPKVEMLFGIPEGLESAVSKKLHGIVRDTKSAREKFNSIYTHQIDLDFTTDNKIEYEKDKFSKVTHNRWMEWGEQPVVSVHRDEPHTITAWEQGEYPGVKMSITYTGPGSDSYYISPSTTHDLILKMHVNPDLTLGYSEDLLLDTVPIGIVGLDDLFNNPTSERSKRIILRFLIESITERNGKPVPIDFGKNKEEERNLLNLIKRDVGDIIKTRNEKSNDWREMSTYERLLMILQPNWILFHPKIKTTIAEAFNMYY